MKIKHNDIIISKETPFENCKLGRKKYADILTNLIGSYADGFVLAINNEWGTGKTTFLKMWQQQLLNGDYKTLYFNAWENDFDSDPLIALLSELKTLTPKSNDATFKVLLKKGAIISKSVLPVIIKAIAKKYIDAEEITEAIGKLTEAATDILKEEIDEYANKKKGLTEFKTELESFIAKNTEGKPLIFFIDELDRCRPTYAVEVLEQVKHFFSVPGIVFVLSIDKEQLGNAIKGFYGSEQLNTTEYLRRFVDLEYIIPAPDTETFCKYLYSYFQFDDFFYSAGRTQYNEFREEKNAFLKFSSILFTEARATLRQQEKIFAHARVVLSFFKENNYLFPTLFILLIYIRDFNRNLYKQIRERQLAPQDLIKKVEPIFPRNIDKYDLRLFLSVEALLILFYNNYYSEIVRGSKVFEWNIEADKNVLLVKPGIDDDENNTFLSFIESYDRTNYSNMKLDYLLNRIDLMGDLTV